MSNDICQSKVEEKGNSFSISGEVWAKHGAYFLSHSEMARFVP